jgi:hypothetical protein
MAKTIQPRSTGLRRSIVGSLINTSSRLIKVIQTGGHTIRA